VRDVVHSNEFYISALQEAHKEIADLYPFWQLRQANLNYELTILGVGYVKEGATDPLQSYHAMEFPITLLPAHSMFKSTTASIPS